MLLITLVISNGAVFSYRAVSAMNGVVAGIIVPIVNESNSAPLGCRTVKANVGEARAIRKRTGAN